MFARIITADLYPGKREDAIKIWEENVAPAFKHLRGCKGGYLLTHPTSHTFISISFWESDEAAQEYETSGLYKKLATKFGDIFTTRPTRELYPVSVHIEPEK